MSSLDVHLNRDRPRSIEAPGEFTTRRTFEVYVENHGDGSHVHLRLDDRLSRVATLRDGNEYVPAGEAVRVQVAVQPVDQPVSGTLTVSVGYGAVTVEIDVTVSPPRENDERVRIDETLAKPQSQEAEGSRRLPSVQTAALLSLAGVAVAVAAAAALTVQSTVVTLAAVVVVVAVLGTVAIALR